VPVRKEHRDAIGHGQRRRHERQRKLAELEREAKRLRPSDLIAFEKLGLVHERLAPLVELAGVEAANVLGGLGGPENVSPQRQVLLEDFTRLGVALRALTGLLVQGGDVAELSSRIATLANARRQHLQALGLERYEKSLDLDTYARAVHEAHEREASEAGPLPGPERQRPSPGAAGAGAAASRSDDRDVAPRANALEEAI
jgi:hypothetical protein